MSIADTATTDPETKQPAVTEDPVEERAEDPMDDVPTPGGLRGLV